MNSAGSLWSGLPLSTGIATLVTYAGVFGDVIGIEEMAERLGVVDQAEYSATLEALHRQGRLIRDSGFAALPHLREKISLKVSKIATTRQLIASGMEDIKKLGGNPLVKFVGISGSLAASNPTRDRNNHLDIDIFMITRSQCLWLYVIPRNLLSLLPGRKIEPELCVNLIMDESSLEVANRNFYTATEIRNLIPVAGEEAYRKFLQANRWVDFYYPGFSGSTGPAEVASSGNLINKMLYVMYSLMKSIKLLSLEPLRKASFQADSLSGINFNRVSVCYGGYQGLVNNKFTRLAADWFPDLLDAALIEKMFPDELSVRMRQGSIDVFKLNADEGLRYDYSKYA